MGHQLKFGDGILAGTATPAELKHICELIDKAEGVKNYCEISLRDDDEWVRNHFVFNDEFWLTSGKRNITNPLTYKQIVDKLQGNEKEIYEIY